MRKFAAAAVFLLCLAAAAEACPVGTQFQLVGGQLVEVNPFAAGGFGFQFGNGFAPLGAGSFAINTGAGNLNINSVVGGRRGVREVRGIRPIRRGRR